MGRLAMAPTTARDYTGMKGCHVTNSKKRSLWLTFFQIHIPEQQGSSYRLPVENRGVEFQSYAEMSIGQGLAVNDFHLRPKLARTPGKACLLIGVPSALRQNAGSIGTHVHGYRLLGNVKFVHDYKANWDCHRDALFSSSIQTHGTRFLQDQPLPEAWAGQRCSQIVFP